MFVYFLALHAQEGKLENIAPYKECAEVRNFMHVVTLLPISLTFNFFLNIQQHCTGHEVQVL